MRLNVECVKLTLSQLRRCIAPKRLAFHVREIDVGGTGIRRVSSLTLEIAKTPRHHFNLFTSARRSLSGPLPSPIPFPSLSAREHAHRILVAPASLSART